MPFHERPNCLQSHGTPRCRPQFTDTVTYLDDDRLTARLKANSHVVVVATSAKANSASEKECQSRLRGSVTDQGHAISWAHTLVGSERCTSCVAVSSMCAATRFLS